MKIEGKSQMMKTSGIGKEPFSHHLHTCEESFTPNQTPYHPLHPVIEAQWSIIGPD